MSETPEWRRAVKRPAKPKCYNVRVISRATDGTLIVIDLSEVPAESWSKHLGFPMLAKIRSVDASEVEEPPCPDCGGRGWVVGECHPQEVCGGCKAPKPPTAPTEPSSHG